MGVGGDGGGWGKMFLAYMRRKVLTDVGRADDLLEDEGKGTRYRTWMYGPQQPGQIYCKDEENCVDPK